MLISDCGLETIKDHFNKPPHNIYEESYKNDQPAEVRILVRLPAAVRFPHLEIVGALHIQQKSNPKDTKSTPQPLPMEMTEVERFKIKARRADQFSPFEQVFQTNADYDIRVTFFISSYGDSGVIEKPIGSANVNLKDVIEGEFERKEVNLVSPDGNRDMKTRAEFTVEWCKMASAVLSIEVRMRVVDKNNGWPFSATRLFFMIFRWEPQGASWMPLYRSEVLTKPSDIVNARGSMIFQLAETYLKQANDGVDDRPIRFEFFHFETEGVPKLLGFLSTSLKDLRQCSNDYKLDLKLNAFEQGELMGKLMMRNSQITLNRHFFVVQADFGGKIKGDFIFFDICFTPGHKQPWLKGFRSMRPFYIISRFGDHGEWEDVYRSEVLSLGHGRRPNRYDLAKIDQRKINVGQKQRKLCISFYYQKHGGDNINIGYFETNFNTLFQANRGIVFPLKPFQTENMANAEGYVTVEQSEVGESVLYCAAHCILGQSAPADARAPPLVDMPN